MRTNVPSTNTTVMRTLAATTTRVVSSAAATRVMWVTVGLVNVRFLYFFRRFLWALSFYFVLCNISRF